MNKIQQPRVSPSVGQPPLDISRREWRHYSILNAIRNMREGKSVGFEGECHQELTLRGFQSKANGGVLIPTTALVGTRDMTAGSPSGGGYLVGTQNMSFIDMLRSQLVLGKMGATILSGLQGNITIPRLTAGGTAHWLTNDTTAITESNQTLDQVVLTPKNVGAYTEISRQLIMQSSPAADAIVASALAKDVAQAIDLAAISGTGLDGQPLGLLATAGIGAVTGTSLGYAGVLEFMTDVIGQNASINPQSAGLVTTPAVAALLMTRQKVASTYSPIWSGNVGEGNVDGFKAMSTTACPTATAIFADWSSILIGEWGILEIASNPFADFAKGITGIRAIQTVGVAIRHPQSFSVAAGIT